MNPLPSDEVVPFRTPDRSPPHSAEAEEHVIACCLLDEGSTLDRCLQAGLSTESFYFPANQVIFSTLKEMRKDKKDIGLEILGQELTANRTLQAVGGYAYLMQVTGKIPTTAHAGYMIEKVREKHLLREAIRAAATTIEEAYSFNGDIKEFVSLARDRMPHPDSIHGRNGAYTVWQPAAFRAYTPPVNMNLVGGGYIRRRQLTTLIGPPGVGKSRLSLWLACLQISNRPFAGLDTANGPCKWLFFGNENDPIRQKNDLDWFYRNLTAADQAKVDANLYMHVIDKPDDGIITLADPDAYHKLRTTLKQVVPDVVVFDPWGNMIEGNENDNEEVRKTLKLLIRAISENCPDAAIIVIHHARTGKATAIEAGNNYSGGNLGRGSKALVSSARCELALWPGDAEDSSKLVLTCEKANNVQKFEPKGLTFENGIYTENEGFDLQAWRDDIEGTRGGKTLTIRDVVEIIRKGTHRSADIVAKCEQDFGVQKRTVFTRLNEACEKGYLAKTVPAGSYTLGDKRIT